MNTAAHRGGELAERLFGSASTAFMVSALLTTTAFGLLLSEVQTAKAQASELRRSGLERARRVDVLEAQVGLLEVRVDRALPAATDVRSITFTTSAGVELPDRFDLAVHGQRFTCTTTSATTFTCALPQEAP